MSAPANTTSKAGLNLLSRSRIRNRNCSTHRRTVGTSRPADRQRTERSRGTYWPLLSMTQSLKAVDASSSSAAFLRPEAEKIFGGLLKFQDPDRRMWRLVIDEPTTRLESSASSGFVYCYDQLRSINANYNATACAAE